MRNAVPAAGFDEGAPAAAPASAILPSPSSSLIRSRDRPLACASALSRRTPADSITPSMMVSPDSTRYSWAMAFEITTGAMARLRSEASSAGPRECCGLLLGRGRRIDVAKPADNIADRPESRFEIDPAALFAAHRSARAGGPELVGYYHSHPTGYPSPSATDCTHASGDGRVWAIVAGDEVALWRDTPGGFEPLPYRMVDG